MDGTATTERPLRYTHVQVPFCPSSLSSLPLSPPLAAHSFLTELMFVRSARKDAPVGTARRGFVHPGRGTPW